MDLRSDLLCHRPNIASAVAPVGVKIMTLGYAWDVGFTVYASEVYHDSPNIQNPRKGDSGFGKPLL